MFDTTTTPTITGETFLAPRPTGISVGYGSHPGRARASNEDACEVASDIGFFVVADGVASAPAGAVAARMAAAAMVSFLRQSPPPEANIDSDVPREDAVTHSARLAAAAHHAHTMICSYAVKNGCWGAATTMAALWVVGDKALVANAGDSRVYRLRADRLELLSKDHTVLQEYVEQFGPAPPELAGRLGSIVTEVLGGKKARTPNVRLAAHPLDRSEVFLLCSDGLTNMVREQDIAFVLALSATPQDAADSLIALANAEGGADNITCVVAHVTPR